MIVYLMKLKNKIGLIDQHLIFQKNKQQLQNLLIQMFKNIVIISLMKLKLNSNSIFNILRIEI
jgi:hypothetical protein